MTAQLVWEGFWGTLSQMSPYLLFGFAMAGVLSVTISPETVERHLGGKTNPLWAVVKASLLGVPLPLCSCGVIPVTASLRKHGASRGAAISFLISTPQTGVDNILATYGLLGPVFAAFCPVVTFLSGIAGGLAVHWFDRKDDGQAEAPPECEDACCADEGPRSHPVVSALRYGFVTLPRDIGGALLVGLIAAGVISAFVPPNFFQDILTPVSERLGPTGARAVSMLLMLLVGIPIYVCATASIPIAAALIAKGISPGAALVFLMTGPATNAATIAMVWNTMGRRTAVLYVSSVAFMALLAGLILDLSFPALAVSMAHHIHPDDIGWVGRSSAVVLSAVLLAAVLPQLLARWKRKADVGSGGAVMPATATDGTVTLSVTGMTCAHCVQNVQSALAACPGVTGADVDLSAGTATVRGGTLDVATLLRAVDKLGFTAKQLMGICLLLLAGCTTAPQSQPPRLPELSLPKLSPVRLARALHAERITSGLQGEELRQARFENMVESLMDARDLEEQIAFLKKEPWSWERRRKLKQNKAWLKNVRQSFAENSAAFPPEERAATAREDFLDIDDKRFVRKVTVTLNSGKVIVLEKEYDKLPRTAPPGPLDSAR